MAYEYEKFILSLLTSLAIKKENKGYYVIADEVEDVYAKAKAFDKLVEFYPQKDEIPSDEFFMMMGYIIKEDDLDGV